MFTESCQKVASRFCCKNCDYFTDKKSSFDKHLLTSKHIKLIEVNDFSNKSCQKVADNIKEFICGCCSKKFKSRVGLWKHKQKCICDNVKLGDETQVPFGPLEPTKKLTELDKDDLIITLLKQNADLIKCQQDMMIKLTENGITNTNHSHNTTNSHNKAFNLNFFLNETCKNAMNITDFVNSIKLQLSDLMEVGEIGFVEGLSKIIIKNLNDLDETLRPIHCTDKKRETMYIKDQNKWEKDDDNKSRLRKAVKSVADKNIRLLPQFRQKYPDYGDAYSKTSDIYNKMVVEAMVTDVEKEDKIIHNISKVTTIKEH